MTAATRSLRFICRWQRSDRSPHRPGGTGPDHAPVGRGDHTPPHGRRVNFPCSASQHKRVARRGYRRRGHMKARREICLSRFAWQREPSQSALQPRKGFQNLGFDGVLWVLSAAVGRKYPAGGIYTLQDVRCTGRTEASVPTRERGNGLPQPVTSVIGFAMTGCPEYLQAPAAGCGHPALQKRIKGMRRGGVFDSSMRKNKIAPGQNAKDDAITP